MAAARDNKMRHAVAATSGNRVLKPAAQRYVTLRMRLTSCRSSWVIGLHVDMQYAMDA